MYVIANWKSSDSFSLCSSYIELFSGYSYYHTDLRIIVCPPAPYLSFLDSQIQKYSVVKNAISLAGQDCSTFDSRSCTGEITPNILKSVGCEYVIIGHAERRIHLKEDNDQIIKKISLAQKYGLTVILCIGESYDAYINNKGDEFLKEQMEGILSHDSRNSREDSGDYNSRILNNDINYDLNHNASFIFSELEVSKLDLAKLIIAYEPVWAIGRNIEFTKRTMEYIEGKIDLIKNTLSVPYVLYGGSVNKDNVNVVLQISNSDGILVGGASTEIASFSHILNACLHHVS